MGSKKIFLAVVCALVVASCGQKKGQTEGAEGAADSLHAEQVDGDKMFTPEQICKGWAKVDIPVDNGGEKPSIALLLAAFNKAWPTEAYNSIPTLKKGQTRLYTVTNKDAGGSSEIDIQEGYANVMPGDTPEDILHADIWRRTNGHTLFGVSICGREGDNPPLALCFYDYDPKTQTMKPEADNAVLKFRAAKGHKVDYVLPEMGTAILVGELNEDYCHTWNVYDWDGMKVSMVNSYNEDELAEALDGTWMNEDESFPFTFIINLVGEGGVSINDCGIYGSTLYDNVDCTVYHGKLNIWEMSADELGPDERPGLSCDFYLTKDGKLKGGYYISQSGGREWRGIMTLVKKDDLEQSDLNNYAE
ncbi:MAG: hypothetical protein IJ804_07305 [Prevotella sp.]|nr:hypothetical protein [Prevotella sp.]